MSMKYFTVLVYSLYGNTQFTTFNRLLT